MYERWSIDTRRETKTWPEDADEGLLQDIDDEQDKEFRSGMRYLLKKTTIHFKSDRIEQNRVVKFPQNPLP